MLGIDPGRIAGAGGSAGGHIAVTAAMIPGLNDATDDISLSARPDALVLFNPVFDNGLKGMVLKGLVIAIGKYPLSKFSTNSFRLSDSPTFRLSDFLTFRLSDFQTFRLSDFQTF